MTKVVAIIPVKGREPLLYHTVNRLTVKGIDCVCVGHTIGERIICEMAGAEFITVNGRNITLGKKWQMALDAARTHKPDAILYMGSSDWVSDHWCDVLMKDLRDGYAMSGTRGIYFLDIQPGNNKRMIWWGGYLEDRGNEPIGTGRLFSSEVLEVLNWRLFDVTKDSSIDYCQMLALQSISGMWPDGKLCKFNESQDIASLSISTYRWNNKHNFHNESKYATAKGLDDVRMNTIIRKYFKEAQNLFNE